MIDVVNRYANQDLFIAERYHQKVTDLVSRSTKDGSPFARQVDAWWLALGIGYRIGVRTPLMEKMVKFNDGGILSSDPWRITHLELLALAEEGQAALSEPARVIRVASEYANTGLDWITDTLLGVPEATLTLFTRMDEHL